MTMTDPIADMLTRIRNANIAMHDEVVMPSSKLKEALAKILLQEGYIEGFETSPRTRPSPAQQADDHAEVHARPQAHDLRHLRRVSKPGLRVYSAATDVPRVLGGMGIAILSTNQGLLTDREARKRRVGGEILCQVW